MNIRMDELLRCVATAMDAVESDLLGASTNHGKRIGTLCIAMGKQLGYSDDDLIAVASGALLHDNALTEYILSERPGKDQELNMRVHCIYGERNIKALPFKGRINGLVLYHHEMADGSGPFGKKEGEFPEGAELIAIADTVDAKLHLQRFPIDQLGWLHENIRSRTGTEFTQRAADAMLAVLDEEMLLSLRDDKIYRTIAAAMPAWTVDIQDRAIVRLAGIAARVIDYKSEYTREHSIQMANMAWWMSGYYGLSGDLRAEIYLAAALHDLGKLYAPTDILEKPGSLTEDEFREIQSHVWWTQELLSEVTGLENLTNWVSNHHEKLNGSGYPAGIKGDQIDFVSRLLVCIDIYQAVRDLRPYHPRRTHEETLEIMNDMVQRGEIDPTIVRALDIEMAQFPEGKLPSPPGAAI